MEKEVKPVLRIAICDDEASERTRLREWLTGYCTAQYLYGDFTEYTSGEALCDDVDDRSAQFDLVFLDIYMDGMNGMECAAAWPLPISAGWKAGTRTRLCICLTARSIWSMKVLRNWSPALAHPAF